MTTKPYFHLVERPDAEDDERVDDLNCFVCDAGIGILIRDNAWGTAYRPVFEPYCVVDGRKCCEDCTTTAEEVVS